MPGLGKSRHFCLTEKEILFLAKSIICDFNLKTLLFNFIKVIIKLN
jgi:hypothetical protein